MKQNFLHSPVIQLALSSIIFGVSSVFVLFIDFDAVVIAFYRLLFGGFLFAAIVIVTRQPLFISPAAIGFAGLSGIMLGVDLSLWNMSILSIGPGIATILNSLQIFFMAGFGVLFFKDALSSRLLLSLIISFIGVVLLCSNEVSDMTNGTFGVVTGVLSALAFAASMLCMRQTARYHSGQLMSIMVYASFAGALALGIFAWIDGRTFTTNDTLSWGMMIFYGSVVHVLAWALMAKALPRVSVAIAGLLICLEPVVVIIIDVLALDKALTLWQITGAVLTITAIYLGSQSKRT